MYEKMPFDKYTKALVKGENNFLVLTVDANALDMAEKWHQWLDTQPQ